MERLLMSPGGRREEQRYPLQARPSRSRVTGALRGEHGVSPKAGEPFDFPRHLSGERMTLRSPNEKESLQGLNDRFAAFIERVRHLERQNGALEEELEALRLRAASSAALSHEYEPEMEELRRQVRDMSVQKRQVELSLQGLQDELDSLREKCEREARDRAQAEQSARALNDFVAQVRSAARDTDRKARALAEEIGLVKSTHEAEVSELVAQLQEGQARRERELSGFGRGELTAALRDIRLQLEGHAAVSDARPAEQSFRAHVAQLTRAAEVNRDTLLATKAEISDYRRQLQSKTVELDSVKGTREALERQLYDLEQRHKAELHHYQDTIRELEHELKNTRYDMSSHVQEYQDLLNVKMALDNEIYSYRKLLEGEESRYSTLSDAHVSVPYVYRQSPIYTLPCVKRQGGAPRKAEPQYKFVEEIITETTREDVEITDTGSEDGSGAGESREPEKVSIEEEDAGKAAPSDVCTEEEDTGAAAPEDDKKSPTQEEEEIKEEQMEKDDESPKTTLEVYGASNEADMGTELKQSEATAPEQTEPENKEETANAHTDSKTQEADKEAKPENIQPDIAGDKEVTLNMEEKEQKAEKEQDKDGKNEQEPTDQKAHEAVEQLKRPDSPPLKEPETKEKAKKEISQKPEDKNVTEKTELVVKSQNAAAEKTPEKDMETSEVKAAEVEVSAADPQPASQKAEADLDTPPKEESKAESNDRVEPSKADVHETQKAEGIKDMDVEDVQKNPEATKQAGGVKKEAPPKHEEKKIEPDQQAESEVHKPAADAEVVKTEMVESAKSTERENTQDDVSKSPAKETKVETSERKDSGTKDVTGSTKIDEEENVVSKEAEKMLDQIQLKEEQPKVVAVETKSEEQPQKNIAKDHVVDTIRREQEEITRSTEKEPEAIQKDKPSVPAEKETKSEAQMETKETKPETSKDTKEVDIIQPKGQETESKTTKGAELDPSVPKASSEKEQSKEQAKTVKQIQEEKDTKREKSEETHIGALQEIPKVDSTKAVSPEKDTTSPKPDQSVEPAPKLSSKKEQDKEQKAAIVDVNKDVEQKKDTEVAGVAENGVTA